MSQGMDAADSDAARPCQSLAVARADPVDEVQDALADDAPPERRQPETAITVLADEPVHELDPLA
jgi:hypothetical protein